MKEFAELYLHLERCSDKSEKLAVLEDYFRLVQSSEAAWAIFLLSHQGIKTLVKTSVLRHIVQHSFEISDWLFDECYSTVDDLCETIALLVPSSESSNSASLASCLEERVPMIEAAPAAEQERLILDAWKELDLSERLIFNRIISGTFRSSISLNMIAEALSAVTKMKTYVIAARLHAKWQASGEFYDQLISSNECDADIFKPYSFASTNRIHSAEEIGDHSSMIIEWKWKGIRAQLVKRDGQISIWSQTQELLNDFFPELIDEARHLEDGVVLDGEILAFKDSDIMPKSALLQRMNRKLSKRILEETPVVFMAHDLLEDQSTDIRMCPIGFRKERLAYVLSSRKQLKSDAEFEQLTLFAPCKLQLSSRLRNSPVLQAANREELEDLLSQARMMKVAGLVLKKKDSQYEKNTDTPNESNISPNWFSLNLASIKLDAVLVAAQPSNGKSRGLFSDYTLALWQDADLLPVARVKSALSEEDALLVDKFVRENTLAKFGPVASVKPVLVFELACEEIQLSQRHKAGLTLTRPRILRLRPDLSARQANSLCSIRSLCD